MIIWYDYIILIICTVSHEDANQNYKCPWNLDLSYHQNKKGSGWPCHRPSCQGYWVVSTKVVQPHHIGYSLTLLSEVPLFCIYTSLMMYVSCTLCKTANSSLLSAKHPVESNCATLRMTSWWLLVRPCNPCLLCEDVDLSNVAKSPVKRIQNKEALRVLLSVYKSTITCNLCRHGYTHVCMHMETPKAFKRVRLNSTHHHTKLDFRKRTATKCANSKLSACRLRFDSPRSSVWQLG